ncbi:MAG TPA: type II secretion system F family protein [Verrucomicrobiae bacterium]|nr:type II secretion system F family protein [Verrucomicrobiae bacterium]
MSKFNYVALDTKGHEITGVLEGDDTTVAVRRIHELGYFPTNVTRVRSDRKTNTPPSRPKTAVRHRTTLLRKGAGQTELKIFQSNKVGSKVLTVFSRQLAALIDAGLPLLRGLDVLREQEENPVLRRTIGRVSEAIESGSTFSDALAQHPKVFNGLYVNMVRAGEVGGVLDVTLDRLAAFQEKAQKIKGKITAALVYPLVVMCVAGAIVSFLMVVIVPKFKEIFADLLEGRPLPALTQVVIGASTLVKERFWLVAVTIFGVWLAVKLASRTTKGRYALDALKLKAPIFGKLIRKASIARFARTLGTLISSGVPILQALTIVRDTTGNAAIAPAITRVHDAVKEGERIVQPLKASRVFPPLVVSMVDVGEQTGALPDMLLKVADIYDDEVDNAVAGITSLLEPIMIVFLAVVVGTIVIAMFLPLISILTIFGG